MAYNDSDLHHRSTTYGSTENHENAPHSHSHTHPPGPGSVMPATPTEYTTRDTHTDNSHRSSAGSTPGAGPSGGHTYQYEEFFGGTIQCPSCRGAGRIPREKENELVALIPFSDKRLKPRRTKLYVLLAVVICLAVAGLLVFFLFPRGVQLRSNMPHLVPTIRIISQKQDKLFISVMNEYNVTNDNFFNIEIQELSVQVLFNHREICKATNNTAVTVSLRQKHRYSIQMNMTFDQDSGLVASYCSGTHLFPHTILLPFTATLTTSYLGKEEQSSLVTYQELICDETPQTTTPAPNITTVSTTTTTSTSTALVL